MAPVQMPGEKKQTIQATAGQASRQHHQRVGKRHSHDPIFASFVEIKYSITFVFSSDLYEYKVRTD